MEINLEELSAQSLADLSLEELPAYRKLLNERMDEILATADAEQHVAAINRLLEELQETRHALWQREAELATGIPVVKRSDDQTIATRLESILESGAEALNCCAASLYLPTNSKSISRSLSWSLPSSVSMTSPVPLGAIHTM